MTHERADGAGKPKPANDNLAPDGEVNAGKADVSGKLDAVVLSIARLIGRQLARERFEALRADNDNAPFIGRKDPEDGNPRSEGDE